VAPWQWWTLSWLFPSESGIVVNKQLDGKALLNFGAVAEK